ncbi:MAG: RMD1 family protein [Rhodospirillales bacterium]
MTTSFEGWQRVRVHALLVGKRIDLRALYRSDSPTATPLAIPAGERGMAVLFRYGVAVMFNLQVVEEAAFLHSLQSVVGDPLDDAEREEVQLAVDPRGEERVDGSGVIHLREVTRERLLIVADVLAKSVSLAWDENRVARVFDRIEPVAEALRRDRGGRAIARQLLDHISDVLITQHRMVGRVEVTEKPELLWDRPQLERLYLRLQEEYELPERDRALTRKLDLIAQTASTALGLLQARRSHRVEWYIVLLIVVEIFLTLYEMFVAHVRWPAG